MDFLRGLFGSGGTTNINEDYLRQLQNAADTSSKIPQVQKRADDSISYSLSKKATEIVKLTDKSLWNVIKKHPGFAAAALIGACLIFVGWPITHAFYKLYKQYKFEAEAEDPSFKKKVKLVFNSYTETANFIRNSADSIKTTVTQTFTGRNK